MSADPITAKVASCISDLQRVALELRKDAGGTDATLAADLRLSVYVAIIERAAFVLKAQDELRLELEQINERIDASIEKSMKKMRMGMT